MSIITNMLRWPLWLLAPLLLAAGCPQPQLASNGAADAEEIAVQPADGATEEPGSTIEPVAVEYPAAPVAYIVDSLRQPASASFPPLESSWLAIARLEHLAESASAAPLRDEILAMRDAAGGDVLPQLAAAWLAVDPAGAQDFIAGRLAEGRSAYVNSLVYSPAAALRIMTAAELDAYDDQLQLRLVRLLVQWHPLGVEFAPLLERLAASDSEAVRLQAIGLLLATDSDRQAEREQLWEAIRDRDSPISAAAEGIKLSRSPQLADALVPLAATVRLGEEDPEADKQKNEVYAAYALAYLPGEQAGLMRRKLLGAVDPTVRWAARLGELLHGDTGYWTLAADRAGIDDAQLWLALEPADVVHPDLLPTLRKAARQGAPQTRLRAAQQLNRYADYASNPAVGEVLADFITDANPAVSAAAWMAAGWLARDQFADQAAGLLDSSELPAEVRMAVAYYLMRLAETRGEEVMQ
jgi:hypothetical protein